MGRKLTHEEYIVKVKNTNPYIEVLGRYINMHTKILHKCKICKHEWSVKPSDIVNKHGCPICSKRIIGNSPEYKNSIWASEHRDYFAKYITEEQMKIYMPYTNKKIEMVCPDCGEHKMTSPNTLLRNGLGCICGDGISYPNKFIYSMLKQLDIEIILEYSPEWANRKQYDIYIPNLKCIVENHGAQHYKDGFTMFNKTYEIEKQNDKEKRQIAKENGIKNYIVIDCRNSNKEWIKQSVLNSELINIIGFSEADIDWDKCDKFAVSNMVKEISDLWNKGMCVEQIIEKVPLKRSAVYNCLNKGAKLLMCDYSNSLSRKRTKAYKQRKENELWLESMIMRDINGLKRGFI